ncbi:MAG: Endoribonuclease YbeY [Planctomycetes bacterium]|nr:Endoribonuclease YbeY [Planctomycetota bacterium]
MPTARDPRIAVAMRTRAAWARRMRADLVRAVTAAGHPGRLSLAVVDDPEMRRLNRDFHDVDEATDVLAFPLAEPEVPLPPGLFHGEVIVSAGTARREALLRGADPRAELVLYAVHGTLHLMGHDDHAPRAARRMHVRTMEILASLGWENSIEWRGGAASTAGVRPEERARPRGERLASPGTGRNARTRPRRRT